MSGRARSKQAFDGLTAGILLAGVGVLLLVDSLSFWPWILVVLGLSSVPGSIARDGLWAGLQGVVWMGGLALLFYYQLFWPGILILIGASLMVGAVVRPHGFGGKRKRGPCEE